MADLVSRRWIVAKGVMFGLIVVLAAAGILLSDDAREEAALLVACVWASARFYYFLFYVLERYVGVEGRYAGILDLVARLRGRRAAPTDRGPAG